jgi:hypothetical protein
MPTWQAEGLLRDKVELDFVGARGDGAGNVAAIE